MKLNYLKYTVFLLLQSFIVVGQDNPALTVMSYNIRLDVASDGENGWEKRKENLAGLIRFYEPAVVGLQEAQRHQLDYLSQALPGYSWTGVGRDDGKDAGEFMAVLYRNDMIDLVRSSTFWCSPTPAAPGLGWDAACNRVVTWGKFRMKKNRREFYFFNTHLDHIGATARRESARLLKDTINAVTGNEPVVITGDFNSAPNDDPYRIIVDTKSKRKFSDSFFSSRRPHYGPAGTFNGFNISEYARDPIDYIFVSAGIEVLSHATLTDSFHGRLPSDHFPVLTTIVLK